MAGIKTFLNHPIYVDWAPSPAPAQSLGMTMAPGKKWLHGLTGSWDLDLAFDLERLKEVYGTDVLVSLLGDHELQKVGISGLIPAAAATRIAVTRFPIRDVSVPESMADTRVLVDTIVRDLAAVVPSSSTAWPDSAATA